MRPITNNKKETHRSRDVIGIQYTSQSLELIDNFFNDVKRKCNSDEEIPSSDDEVILPLIDKFAYNLEHRVLPYILEEKELLAQEKLERRGYDVFSFIHSMYEIDYNSKGEMTEEDLYEYLSIFHWGDRKTYKGGFRLRDNANDLFRLIMNREYAHNKVISYIPFLFNYYTAYLEEDSSLITKENKDEDFLWICDSIKDLITSGTIVNGELFGKKRNFKYKSSNLLAMDIQFDLNSGAVEKIEITKDHFHHHSTETPISIYTNGTANVFVCFNIDDDGNFGIELSDKMASSVKTSVLSLITQLKRGSISSDFFNNTINKFKLNVPTLREGENEVEFLVTFLRELYKHLLGLI